MRLFQGRNAASDESDAALAYISDGMGKTIQLNDQGYY
jgi:hypothetical protein